MGFMVPIIAAAVSSKEQQKGANQEAETYRQQQLEALEPAKRLKRQQMEQAEAFRQKSGDYRQQIGGTLRQQESQNLNQAQKDTANDLSRRGLMFGGISQGAQASNRGRSAASLGKGMQAMNRNLEETASDMENKAIETGMAIQNAQQAASNQLYSRSMAAQNTANQTVASGVQMGMTYGLMGR